MSSFSCPHFEMESDDYCLRLRTDCVPGRAGCVLSNNSVCLEKQKRLEWTGNRDSMS